MVKSLVDGPGRGEFKSFDLVLEHQFPALQLGNPQIVTGKVPESIVQFAFQNSMFPFQFSEMRLNCHSNLLGEMNLRFAPNPKVYMNQNDCRWGLKDPSIIFAGL